MTWTSPATAVTGAVITASFWNINARDNLNETAVAKVTTAGDIVYASGANALSRLAASGHGGKRLAMNAGATAPEWVSPYPDTAKYKSGTQVFTANTTFADITASAGNLSFDVVATGIYTAKLLLTVNYGGTGGVKLQFTGPASPTKVTVHRQYPSVLFDGTTYEVVPTGGVGYDGAAFSSPVLALSSSSSTPGDISGGLIEVDVLIVNGANAGTVTLQGAQNSSNSTTTFGADCVLVPRRIG